MPPHQSPDRREPAYVRDDPDWEVDLLARIRETLRAHNYSRRTARAYLGWIRRFIRFHRGRHPDRLAEPHISSFLTRLAVHHHVSPSTQNQALSALLFLYRRVLQRELEQINTIVRARPTKRLPVVMTQAEVRRVLAQLSGTHQLMASLLYGCGLRLMECLQLRVKDLDFAARIITIRSGKGNKDRLTMLPARLELPLRDHLQTLHAQHLHDVDRGAGWVEFPAGIDRKYRGAGRSWPWQWVFPATRHYRDRATGQLRRHHYHESALQRAVREAVQRSAIPKPASCHTFRHYAEFGIMRSENRGFWGRRAATA